MQVPGAVAVSPQLPIRFVIVAVLEPPRCFDLSGFPGGLLDDSTAIYDATDVFFSRRGRQ
jgi:hypothetical protein